LITFFNEEKNNSLNLISELMPQKTPLALLLQNVIKGGDEPMIVVDAKR